MQVQSYTKAAALAALIVTVAGSASAAPATRETLVLTGSFANVNGDSPPGCGIPEREPSTIDCGNENESWIDAEGRFQVHVNADLEYPWEEGDADRSESRETADPITDGNDAGYGGPYAGRTFMYQLNEPVTALRFRVPVTVEYAGAQLADREVMDASAQARVFLRGSATTWNKCHRGQPCTSQPYPADVVIATDADPTVSDRAFEMTFDLHHPVPGQLLPKGAIYVKVNLRAHARLDCSYDLPTPEDDSSGLEVPGVTLSVWDPMPGEPEPTRDWVSAIAFATIHPPEATITK